jgi:hypothetical protein
VDINNKPLIDDVTAMLDYLWHDEQKHYDESGKPKSHIYLNLKRIRDAFGLDESYLEYEESGVD